MNNFSGVLTNSSSLIFQAEPCILEKNSTYFEAKTYWLTAFKTITDSIVKLDRHISNPHAITALYENLPRTINTIDLSDCSFSENVLHHILNPKERPNVCLILPFLPFDQLPFITADKLVNFDRIIIQPPKEGATAEKIESLTQLVHKIYCHTDRLPLDLSRWKLSDELKVYEKKGLRLDLTYGADFMLAPPHGKIPVFELLTDENMSLKELQEEWKNFLIQKQSDLQIGDSSCYTYVANSLFVTIFFQVLPPNVATLNLNNLLFSDDAWQTFVKLLGEREQPVTSLQFDQVTLDQLETLLSTLPQKFLSNLESLNFSRDGNNVILEGEKRRLSELFKKHLSKCPNLQILTLLDWYLSDEHLDFLVSLPKTKIYIQNHRIVNDYQNVQLRVSGPQGSEEMLFSNNELDKNALVANWKEHFLNYESKISLGSNDSALLLVDSPLSISVFFDQITKTSTIVKLSFNKFQFTDRAWKTVQENLINTRITSLNFTGCHLSPAMVSSLKDLNTLTEFSLNSNACLTEKKEFCEAIKAVISNNPNLKRLSLTGNTLNNSDVELLFSTIGELTHIFLGHNAITNTGKLFLQSISHKNCTLDLSDNPISLKANKVPSQEPTLDNLLESFEALTPEFYNDYHYTLVKLHSITKEVYFRKLLANQFNIIDVAADGNCLFRACSIETGKTQQELRKNVVDYMLENPILFKPFMEDGKTVDEHATLMKKDKTWGGQVEIVALSRILNCSIAVYNKEHPLEVKEGKLVPYEHNIVSMEESVDIFKKPNTILLYRSKENHYLRLQKKNN